MADAPEPGGNGLRVLVVEDSRTQLEELRFHLEKAGFSVVAAVNGKEALAAARAAPFDLVISDIVMPEMDGYELCKALGVDEVLRDLPVILLTSLSDPRNVIRGLESGANNFIRKPYEAPYLLARIQNVLATAQARKGADPEVGVTIRVGGRQFYLSQERLQFLDVLLSAIDDDVCLLPNAPDGPIAGVRVLVVEDSRSQAERIRYVLEECGCTVVTATNGRDGLAALEASKVDIVISDILMPEMDGFAFCRAIRADDRFRGIPVILLTALTDPQDVVTGLDAGATNFIRKPFEDAYLAARVRSLLAGRKGRARGPAAPAIDLVFAGQRYSITADRMQMLDLLVSSYDSAVQESTELARVRDELLLSSERLEARVRERTAALAAEIEERKRVEEERLKLESQLWASQKMEAIGRLAGGVAHDFNNFTAIVLGFGEALLGELPPGDPKCRYVEQIMEAGRRSASLTRQLLALSRRQTLQPEVLDLNARLRGFEKMIAPLLGADVELELRLAGGPVWIKADPGQVDQVVTNLALNARDSMPMGGRLTVETVGVEAGGAGLPGSESLVPGEYVLLTVTDTGCGMDRATVARAFEPFFTTKPKGKGTGLGLATVFGIVKQSGGNITIASEQGRGTTIKVYLPRTDEEPQARGVAARDEMPRGRGERVLLVDDEAPLRSLCEMYLLRLGYRVRAAASGQQALALVGSGEFHPDVVVTDVIMPGMSGAELADRLREGRPDLGVLYMSGYTDDIIARHGVLEEGVRFLQKPFTEREFAVKVSEALGRKAAAACAARRVLMIDDDEQFRDLVRLFCEGRGYVLEGVDSSAAALELLAGKPFDVLLVDLNIPGTDGGRILEEIRAAGHAAPAIVLTGDLSSADMGMLRPLGAVAALEKSSTAGPLLRAIEAATAPG